MFYHLSTYLIPYARFTVVAVTSALTYLYFLLQAINLCESKTSIRAIAVLLSIVQCSIIHKTVFHYKYGCRFSIILVLLVQNTINQKGPRQKRPFSLNIHT